MNAIILLMRYSSGKINPEQSGILYHVMWWEEGLQNFLRSMFGKEMRVIDGELEKGKSYLYAYAEGEDYPDGFTKDDEAAMCIDDGYGSKVWLYEIS